MAASSCDIFCRVIDNYGDVAVCWRMARQLAAEHGLTVRLWVDDLASFAHIAPAIDPHAHSQSLAGVSVCAWIAAAAQAVPADIVIEAFACEPPHAYIRAMATRARRPAWINLEYLSAESWIEDCHGLGSPHPRLPLIRHFFFPGFTLRTGGLLREAWLDPQRIAFQRDSALIERFWQSLGVPPPAAHRLKVSLFGYESASLPSLLEAWSTGQRPITCILPDGRLRPAAERWAGHALKPGNTEERGSLRLHVVPFMPQEDYDRLLWACDLNFARGEDSFVRAQWARKPLVWHIYRQDDDAHRTKLDAFLARYTAGLRGLAAAALEDFWHAWDRGQDMTAPWAAVESQLPELALHAEAWAEETASHGDLSSKLLIFCEKLV